MTTMILENEPLIHGIRNKPSWWRTLPGRLAALLRRLGERLNSIEPDMTAYERMKESHHSRYMHLIHKM